MKNPKSPFCVTSTFNGTCAGGFSGDGDAVQLAIAKEAFTRNCQLFDLKTSDAAAFESHQNVTPNLSSDTVTIGPSSFDQSNALGVGASCITDQTLTVMGAVATLPFSRVCPFLGWLGLLNLSLSFLVAAVIIGRG